MAAWVGCLLRAGTVAGCHFQQLVRFDIRILQINWIIIGFCALATSLVLAEICSAMPTAGGIYCE